MSYYQYREFCLCPRGGQLPEGAKTVEEPFSPLVFLVARDPLLSRGLFAIHTLSELDEPEGINLLLPPPEDGGKNDALARFVKEHGATIANTAFTRWFRVLQESFFHKDMAPVLHVVLSPVFRRRE